MTFREALANHVRFIRLPQWADGAYLELPLLADGGHGPWVTLYDPNVPPFTSQIVIFAFDADTESRYDVAPDPSPAPEAPHE